MPTTAMDMYFDHIDRLQAVVDAARAVCEVDLYGAYEHRLREAIAALEKE